MNLVQIGRERFSEIFWNIVDEKAPAPWSDVEDIVSGQQALREHADYNTGSLPHDDAYELYKLVKFFQPKVIAEVGTFIGVSTNAMYKACKGEVDICTCDVSNDINLNLPSNVYQYPKQTSTQMFKDMAEKEVKVDLVYLDGRLQQDDIEPLNKILHERTVFVMDDFEGIEKGVLNAMMLESPGRILIYPREGRKTAVSLPFTMLQFVAQEAT